MYVARSLRMGFKLAQIHPNRVRRRGDGPYGFNHLNAGRNAESTPSRRRPAGVSIRIGVSVLGGDRGRKNETDLVNIAVISEFHNVRDVDGGCRFRWNVTNGDGKGWTAMSENLLRNAS